jgi:hypothetical protein
MMNDEFWGKEKLSEGANFKKNDFFKFCSLCPSRGANLVVGAIVKFKIAIYI